MTAADVVPCGGPKKYPRTPSIVQIIIFFRSFEISKDIYCVQNTYVYKHTSKQCFNYLTQFRNVFDLGFSYNFLKLQHYSLASVAKLKRATDEGSLPEIAQYSPYYLLLGVLSNHYV